ncbi:MAG TPA: hypothetical protein VFX47_04760 [Gammaproteobacteria bacterium]|nr:hypothetical protein [Gammaproteobacteria bacterium]
MKGLLRLVFLGILIFSVTSTASAAVYKCTVKDEIVYSAHPCGKDAVKLKLKDQGYSAPQVEASAIAETSSASPSGRAHSSKSLKHTCPIDSMDSIELRNMRVSNVIMACESADQVRATWGKPDSIKRTVSKGHVRERWVYNGPRGKPARSVNLEDGKVTSFQK